MFASWDEREGLDTLEIRLQISRAHGEVGSGVCISKNDHLEQQ